LSRREGEPRLGAVSGGIRCHSLSRHGTDHDSKPLPSFPRFCLPARPLQYRQEEHRSGRATARGFGCSLLALPFAGPRLRSSRRTRFEFIPLWGFSSSFYTPCGAAAVMKRGGGGPFARLGRQISRRVVPPSHAIPHRADEEDPRLKSSCEILRLSHLPDARTGPLSFTWEAASAEITHDFF
jgi:hypothetical protein